MKVIKLILLFSIFFSCNKFKDNIDVKNLNNNEILILGHKGMGELYKHAGNSYEAIIPVIGIGADGTEVDVQMTKDSVLVLFHDFDMKLTSTCEGFIYNHTWAELGGCKYHSSEHNTYVITLENLFTRIPNLTDYYFSLDCKIIPGLTNNETYYKQLLREIKRICEKYNMTNNVFIESNKDMLDYIAEIGIENRFFISGTGSFEESFKIAVEKNIYGIAIDGHIITNSQVELAHSKNKWIMVWGAKTRAENKELILKNPDIIQTDKPIPMLKLFDKYNKDYNIP